MINAMHGLWNKDNFNPWLNLVAHYKFNAANGLIDTANQNTIDTSGGYTSFTRVWDFSGAGKHLTFPSKAAAFRFVNNSAQLLGAQYANRITDQNVNVGTVILVIDAGSITAANPFMPLGSFSIDNSGSFGNGFIGFGQVTGQVAGETFCFNHRGTFAETAIYTNQNLSGYNIIGVTTHQSGNPAARQVIINGNSATVLQTATFAGSSGTLDLQLGRRIGTTQYFTGNIKEVLIYSDYKTLSQHQQINPYLSLIT